MSELEDILEKKGSRKRSKEDFFRVEHEYEEKILEFVAEHGIQVQEAQYEKRYICPDGIHSGVDYSQTSPDIYLLETKYGKLRIRHSRCGGWSFVKIEYKYSRPEEKEEIRRLFHAEEE